MPEHIMDGYEEKCNKPVIEKPSQILPCCGWDCYMMMGMEAPLMTLLSGVVEPLSQKLELVLQSSYIRTVFFLSFFGAPAS